MSRPRVLMIAVVAFSAGVAVTSLARISTSSDSDEVPAHVRAPTERDPERPVRTTRRAAADTSPDAGVPVPPDRKDAVAPSADDPVAARLAAYYAEIGLDHVARRVGAPVRTCSMAGADRWISHPTDARAMRESAVLRDSESVNLATPAAMASGEFEVFAWAPPDASRFEVTTGEQVQPGAPTVDELAALYLSRIDRYAPRRSPPGKRGREITDAAWSRVQAHLLAWRLDHERSRRAGWSDLSDRIGRGDADRLTPATFAAVLIRGGVVVAVPRQSDPELERRIETHESWLTANIRGGGVRGPR